MLRNQVPVKHKLPVDEDYAAERKLIYLDYYSAMVDNKGFLKDELSDDGLHPNEKVML